MASRKNATTIEVRLTELCTPTKEIWRPAYKAWGMFCEKVIPIEHYFKKKGFKYKRNPLLKVIYTNNHVLTDHMPRMTFEKYNVNLHSIRYFFVKKPVNY